MFLLNGSPGEPGRVPQLQLGVLPGEVCQRGDHGAPRHRQEGEQEPRGGDQGPPRPGKACPTQYVVKPNRI